MPSTSASGHVQARRSIQKLEDSPSRTVRESVGACRSVAKALADQSPDLLHEFKALLHVFLNQWMDRLDGQVNCSEPSADPRIDGQGGAQ